MIRLLLSSTVRMVSEIADGARVGWMRIAQLHAMAAIWGLLRLVSCALPSTLLGRTTRSFEPFSRWVARQLVSTTRPSVPSFSTIQSPTS